MKNLLKSLAVAPTKLITEREFRRQEFVRHNERPVEYGFVFQQLSRIYPRSILDVGTGQTALPHLLRSCGFLVTAIDNIRDYWPRGISNRHYHVIDDDITQSRLEGTFDVVTCISVLEHIRDADSAVRGMFRLLNPGGYLFLSFPYSENSYVPNVYDLPGSSYGQRAAFICQSYSRAELDGWVKENGGEIVEQQYWRFWTGEHWTQGEQTIPPERVDASAAHQISCVLIRKSGKMEEDGQADQLRLS